MTLTPLDADPDNFESVLRERLSTLSPIRLELTDESALHAGHEGAKGGGRHYRLRIVSAEFVGKSELQRHRLVYKALGELMRCKIHALSIQSLSPDESRQK